MTHGSVNATDPPVGANWHPPGDVLAGYADGAIDEVVAWSVEAHLETCAGCRTAVSAHVDVERLAHNRAVLLALTALPDDGWRSRVASRVGIPDYLFRLLAATSSLRWSWLLSVLGVLAVVTGEAVLVHHLWPVRGVALGVHPSAADLLPFLVAGPLLVLAGVAAAFMPVLDPSYRLAVAAPFSGVTLLLVRSISALAAALIPVVCAAFLVPGPGWLPAALLLPSLAVCAVALALATVVGPTTAVVASGVLWAGPVTLLALTRAPLATVQGHGQLLCAMALLVATAALFLRRERLEIGWAQ
jgi:putative zinc finger protein